MQEDRSSLIFCHKSCCYRQLCDVILVTASFFQVIAICQGSVATCLKCGGIFCYFLARNLSLNPPVKEF